MDLIPYEILEIITDSLTYKEVVNLRLVCKYLYYNEYIELIQKYKSRCLTMMVRNINPSTLTQTLNSISPYISYWVIGDCNSTDNNFTRKFITNYFSNRKISGEFHELGQFDGPITANKMIKLSKNKAAYIIFIEPISPEKIIINGSDVINRLNLDYYHGRRRSNIDPLGQIYLEPILFKGSLDWEFKGSIVCPYIDTEGRSNGSFENVYIGNVDNDGDSDGDGNDDNDYDDGSDNSNNSNYYRFILLCDVLIYGYIGYTIYKSYQKT